MKGRVLASLGTAALIAACADMPITHSAHWSTFYSSTEAKAAFASRPMPVTVRGNPFDDAPAILRDTVINAMRATYTGRSAGFVASTGSTPDGYHLVARFDPERTQSQLQICDLGNDGTNANGTMQRPSPATRGQRIALQLAYCFNDEVVTTVSGSTPATGPTDPAIQRLIGGMWHDLLPPYNPTTEHDGSELLP